MTCLHDAPDYRCRFYRAMRVHKRGICCHPVSVRLSVTFVSCAKTNEYIFEIFCTRGLSAIAELLVWPCDAMKARPMPSCGIASSLQASTSFQVHRSTNN